MSQHAAHFWNSASEPQAELLEKAANGGKVGKYSMFLKYLMKESGWIMKMLNVELSTYMEGISGPQIVPSKLSRLCQVVGLA